MQKSGLTVEILSEGRLTKTIEGLALGSPLPLVGDVACDEAGANYYKVKLRVFVYGTDGRVRVRLLCGPSRRLTEEGQLGSAKD